MSDDIRTNDEIMDAIEDHLCKTVNLRTAHKIIRSMSSEDLTCYYEENCKKEA